MDLRATGNNEIGESTAVRRDGLSACATEFFTGPQPNDSIRARDEDVSVARHHRRSVLVLRPCSSIRLELNVALEKTTLIARTPLPDSVKAGNDRDNRSKFTTNPFPGVTCANRPS